GSSSASSAKNFPSLRRTSRKGLLSPLTDRSTRTRCSNRSERTRRSTSSRRSPAAELARRPVSEVLCQVLGNNLDDIAIPHIGVVIERVAHTLHDQIRIRKSDLRRFLCHDA